jgi:hypothetical protein
MYNLLYLHLRQDSQQIFVSGLTNSVVCLNNIAPLMIKVLLFILMYTYIWGTFAWDFSQVFTWPPDSYPKWFRSSIYVKILKFSENYFFFNYTHCWAKCWMKLGIFAKYTELKWALVLDKENEVNLRTGFHCMKLCDLSKYADWELWIS